MLCPKCNNPDTRVLETRRMDDGRLRRRRECSCGEKFSTLESIVRFSRSNPVFQNKDHENEQH